MEYYLKLITQEEVEIIISWNYEGIYSFYNMEADPDDLKEFREGAAGNSNYWSVYRSRQLIGFFCFIEQGKNQVEIGLG
ncbi:MAG: hypothetical protein WBV93_20755, partial [Anaerobacillus sp.]